MSMEEEKKKRLILRKRRREKQKGKENGREIGKTMITNTHTKRGREAKIEGEKKRKRRKMGTGKEKTH